MRSSRPLGRTGPGLLILVLALLIVALLAGRALHLFGPRRALPVLGHIPAFSLIDQTDHPFGSEDLKGRVWVASFLYTTCPGPCPLLVQRVSAFQTEFAGVPDVLLVSFSVDPQTDTADVLAEYARTHSIRSDKWRLLTGPVDQVMSTIRTGFYLTAAPASDLPAEGDEVAEASRKMGMQGPIVHSLRLALVDRSLRLRGYYDSNDADELAALSRDIRTLLAERTGS